MRIPDVAPDRIAEIAQFAARSQRDPSANDFQRVLDTSESYAKRVISAARALGLIETADGNTYMYIGPSELATSGLAGWPHLFRLRLQAFIPFLYFAFWISAGDTALGAARKTCVEFNISNNPDSVRRTFYRWGSFGEILEGGPDAPDVAASEWTLATLGFVERLRVSLQEDLSAKLFTMSCLGADVVSEMAQRSIPFSDISDSLRNFEEDAEKAIDSSAQTAEYLLASILRDASPNQQLPSGIGRLIDELKRSNLVTTRHVDVIKALGGLRNATGHAVDRDTGKPWDVSIEGALAGIMLAIISLRSIVKFRASGTQLL